MDKNFMIFIVIGIGSIFFVTNFIGDIQEDDEVYRNDGYDQKRMYDTYNNVDSIGRKILDVTGASASMQIGAWNKSKLKNEFLRLFPDFEEMKIFAQERVRGAILHERLEGSINRVEDAYFSGTLSAEGAKRMLKAIK